MMPTFDLGAFLLVLLDYVAAHPLVWAAGVLLACLLVVRLVLASGVSLTTRRSRYELAMQRVRLDAVARMHEQKGKR
jgi:hypothetical protein